MRKKHVSFLYAVPIPRLRYVRNPFIGTDEVDNKFMFCASDATLAEYPETQLGVMAYWPCGWYVYANLGHSSVLE